MYRKIIKVFLGSPGDLEDERKSAKLIVDEENANHANDLNYQIDLVGWEDTVAQRRRAQDAINVELDQCEYFVGLMWKKWGTPPGPPGHPYSSGFEEEFRRSVDRHDSTGKPEISLLFKELSKDDLLDVGPQLERVLAFQKETTEEKKQTYQKFQNLRDFERKFRATIAKFLKDQQLEDGNSETLELQKPTKIEDKGKLSEKGGTEIGAFDLKEQEFLNDFLTKQQKGANSYSAAEAARFRLLACTVKKSGNDTARLGTHDANLVYRDLRNVEFSFGERNGLVSTAIEKLESSTVPLWHWVFHPDFELNDELLKRTLWRGEKHRLNAFKLLTKLCISPSNLESGLSKTSLVELWFSKEVSNDLVISALEYLGEVGDEGLNVNWSDFVGSSEANIATAAVRASARIKVRSNPTEALKFVARHEGTDLGAKLTEELLANISTVETVVLRECLNNRTKAFQRAIAEQLLNRAALTDADVQLICESTEADIRLIGVNALTMQKPDFSEADARKILVKPRKSSLTGLAGLIASPQDRDYSGENALKFFKIGTMGKLRFDQLLSIQKAENFYSTEATLALYRYHFNRVKSQLAESLLDGFEEFCAGRLPASGVVPTEAVHKFVKDELLQSALEAFCNKATKNDLAIVRTVLDKYSIKFSTEIAGFLAKHGKWEDAARVSKLANNPKYGLGLSLWAAVNRSVDYKFAAKAILNLSAKRIADAWSLDISDAVRVQLVVQMPKKLFTAFDDQKIIKMLLLESDSVRETVALKAVLCFSKARLRKIIDAYYSAGESYYYNVIFWLDLGLAADRKTSKAVALKEFAIK